MPHQCVRCNKLYPDGSNEILKGCSCGGKYFFFIKAESLDAGKKIINDLTPEDKLHIEEDISEILNLKRNPDLPVILDLEAIRVLHPGKYELDLVHLFKKDPLIIKLDEGKYLIDLAQIFKKEREKSESSDEEEF
jgi:predicted  nucleic acid-binding Zn-ribbon protein